MITDNIMDDKIGNIEDEYRWMELGDINTHENIGETGEDNFETLMESNDKHIKGITEKDVFPNKEDNGKSLEETKGSRVNLEPSDFIKIENNSSQDVSQFIQISATGEYSCQNTKCEYKSVTKSNVKVHIRTKHLNLRSYQCKDCAYAARNMQSLKWHISGVHENNTLICPECGFVTKWLTSLNGHIKTVHKGIKRQMGYINTCRHCEFKCYRKDAMKKHVDGKHSNYPLHCDKCTFQTTWKHSLDLHSKSFHDISVNIKNCDDCKFSTKYAENLNLHKFYTHGKGLRNVFEKNQESFYQCHLCESKYKKLSHIKRHDYNKHGNQFIVDTNK